MRSVGKYRVFRLYQLYPMHLVTFGSCSNYLAPLFQVTLIGQADTLHDLHLPYITLNTK